MDDRLDSLVRDFLLGFIKLHILYHASKGPIYGKEFQEEIKRHGYDISYGTLYPIFHRLKNEGYLEDEKVKIDGKIRVYYKITKTGMDTLNLSKEKVKELFNEIIED